MGDEGFGDDPSLATMEQRSARGVEVDARVSAWTAAHTLADLRACWTQPKCRMRPISSIADIVAEPHVQARDTLMTIDDPVIGPV